MIAIEHIYKKALARRIGRVCFDKATGETFPLEKVFFPVSISQGQFAFRRYSEQMEQAAVLDEDAERERGSFLGGVELSERIGEMLHACLSSEDKPVDSSLDRGLLFDSQLPDETQVASTLSDTISGCLKNLDRINERELKAQKWFVGEAGTSESNDEEGLATRIARDLATNRALIDDDSKDKPEIGKDGQEQNVIQGNLNDKSRGPVDALRFDSPHCCSILVPDLTTGGTSRTLMMASAGYGKTTLLKRTALYFCEVSEDDSNESASREDDSHNVGYEEDEVFRKKYCLPVSTRSDYIPCLIRLRDLAEPQKNIIDIIVDSISKTIGYSTKAGVSFSHGTVEQWLANRKLILLLDGLDELEEDGRHSFLDSLNAFYGLYPQTPTVLSTRVAGLIGPGVEDELRALGFKGRAILPLSENESRAYASEWIKITQDQETADELLISLDRIYNDVKYHRWKEFTRKPLELIVILKQLTQGKLYTTRYELFHNMLWDHFTSHEAMREKSAAFSDAMTLLGFIAYRMQNRESLTITVPELEGMEDDFGNLSFYNEQLDSTDMASIVRRLDDYAANIGIIEKGVRDGIAEYTFPIRSHQEFLTAYACCHLRLTPNSTSPKPLEIAISHIADSQWSNIICFMLVDLEATKPNEFDLLLDMLIVNVRDENTLIDVVECDIEFGIEEASKLCALHFEGEILPESKRRLLATCIKSKSIDVFRDAMERLALRRLDDRSKPRYDWANACVEVGWNLELGLSPVKAAVSHLAGQTARETLLGASMLGVLAEMLLDENDDFIEPETLLIVKQELQTERQETALDTVGKLATLSGSSREFWYVKAITDIWIADSGIWRKAVELLCKSDSITSALVEVMLNCINDHNQSFNRILAIKAEAKKNRDYWIAKELFQTLGSLPLTATEGDGRRVKVIGTASVVLEALYKRAISDWDYDLAAMAVARLRCGWRKECFSRAWAFDVCRGKPMLLVRKDTYSTRESNHFSLLKQEYPKMKRWYDEARANESAVVNTIQYRALTSDSFESPITMFDAGEIEMAERFCVRSIKNGNSADKVNLAFLIRYSGINPSAFGLDDNYSVESLLDDGISKDEPFAKLNMALHLLGRDNAAVQELITTIKPDQWKALAEGFWHEHVWVMRGDPEGGLVCLWASELGNCTFPDLEIMKAAALEAYRSNARPYSPEISHNVSPS